MSSKNNSSTKLIDTFGRLHNYLRVSLTEQCNLRCFYCMPLEGPKLKPRAHYMNAEEIISLAKTFVELGVTKIRLTGGEPLLRNDFDEILESLATLHVELAITTNGVYLDKHIDSFLKYGLRSVNVSLDTLNASRFKEITHRDEFDKVVQNIHLMLENNFHLKINAVITKGTNDDEILDFIEYTKNKNIHMRFIEFMPFKGNQWDWSKGVSYKEIVAMAENRYGTSLERIEDRKHDTSKNYRIKGYEGTFAIISSVSNPFCDTCNRLRLTADGKMKNCLFSGEETDLLSALRKGEDVEPLIRASVLNKKAARAGMDSMEDFSKTDEHEKNRAMVGIGG